MTSPRRWRVWRCCASGNHPTWVASDPACGDDCGRCTPFPTHAEAVQYATTQATQARTEQEPCS